MIERGRVSNAVLLSARWPVRLVSVADCDFMAITFENVLENDGQTHAALQATFAVDVQVNLSDNMRVHILPNELLDFRHGAFEFIMLGNAFQDLGVHAAESGGRTHAIVQLVGVDFENRNLIMTLTFCCSRSGGN